MKNFSFNFNKEKKLDEELILNPWAGLAHYEDPATTEIPLKFCGRDDESYDLSKLIIGNLFVTLYGKSGIGKTSLLNAGVFPELREENFTPLNIRLGMSDDENPESYQDIIINAVERAFKRIEIIDEVPLSESQQSSDYLWKYFASRSFYNEADNQSIPVIVLDQFEEVFRQNIEEVETLLRQLEQCVVNSQSHRYNVNARFVISIREDDLYLLEDSVDNCYLSALKRCRYRLRSLSDEGARAAILNPGENLYKEEDKDNIVEAIINKSRNSDGSISTNIISLLCNRIFVEYKHSRSNYIVLELVENFIKGDPIEKFYKKATSSLSNSEKSYIEENLVDSLGRRNSVSENDFYLHIKNGDFLLGGKNRILQRTKTLSDGQNYRIELIHDSFCKPLMIQKRKREQKRKLKSNFLIMVFVILISGVIALIIMNNEKERNIDILESENSEQRNTHVYDQEVKNRQAYDIDSLKKEISEKDSLIYNYSLKLTSVEFDLLIKNGIIFRLDSTNLEYRKEILQNNILHARFIVREANELVYSDSYLARRLLLGVLPEDVLLFNKITEQREVEKLLRRATQCNNTILKGHTASVSFASFSPDGKYIVSASWDKTIRIWDAWNGKEVKKITGHGRWTNSATYSPDGKNVVSASSDSTIRIWDVLTGKELQTLTGHTDRVNSAIFSPDGRYIVSASSDSTIRVWDAQTGTELQKLTGHTDRVNSAIFSPDGRCIVSASSDSTIRVWDAQRGTELKKITGHADHVNSANYSPDGQYIVSTSNDATIRIWDAQTGVELQKLTGHTSWVGSANFSPDGKYIVSASDDKTVRIWDAQTGEELQKIRGHMGVVCSANFSPDGKYIVSASWDKTIRVRDAINGKEIKKIWHGCWTSSATYSPNGNSILFISSNTAISILNSQTGTELSKLTGHTDRVNSAIFSPDGRYIVSASSDSTIRVWDAQTGTELQKLTGHTDRVNSAIFSPDGKYIVSASWDETIRIWDAQTGTELQKLTGHTDRVNSAIFSPDGKYIVSASSDSTIRVWDAQRGTESKKITGHADHVNSAAFSPDGKCIVSASWDKTIRIWDAQTGEELQKLTGHTDLVNSAIFSPDGKYIVSASWDETIRIWDAQTGTELQKLTGHTDRVNSAIFSPDGRYIMSVSRDRTIRIWDFPPLQELIDQTRERFKDYPLTPEERRQYYLE